MLKATREQTRSHNKRLILKTIYQEEEISRAAIARHTHLTRTTVSHIVAELITEGLVIESGQGPSLGGKPPVLLRVPPQARVIIGVDLANSEFRGAVLDMRGEILYEQQTPVQNCSGQEALDYSYALIASLLKNAEAPVLGIGVGTPGLVDARNGIVRQAVNLEWQDLPLGDLLRARFDLPVYVSNDSHLAALGQYTFGRYSGVANHIVVKVGRGIGAGIVLDGRLHHGDGSGAGEIGHVRAVEDGVACLCGHIGCLETVASTRAIVQQAQAFARLSPTASINDRVHSPEAITTEILLKAVHDGDTDMCRLVETAGFHLGRAIAHLVGALNIEHIIVAGSMARFGDPLLRSVKASLRPRAMAQLVAETQVELSDLGQDIVLLGAASLILSSELGAV